MSGVCLLCIIIFLKRWIFFFFWQASYSAVDDSIKKAFQEIVGEKNVSSAMVVREQHGKDESHHKCHPADLVVWPENKEQVSEVAKLCNDHCIPLIPFGSGTGLEGGVVAKKVNACFFNHSACRWKTYHVSISWITLQDFVTVR